MISNVLSSTGLFRDPLTTKQILNSLTNHQNQLLDNGKFLFNPITGDLIVPIVTQNEVAKIIINIF